MVKKIAIIPAAGMGKRMGAGINKQYLLLSGMPIVARTLAAFEKAGFIDDIYLVIPEQEIPFCREQVLKPYGFGKVRDVIAGGAERQHSVLNGLRGVRSPADDDIVLIHDGVRPFVSLEVLAEACRVAETEEGALVAVPVKDTVKRVEGGVVAGTPPRDELWLAQTPQAFRYSVIRSAHERAAADGFLGTDDASLVERTGGRVRIVPGDYRNIKITTPEDLVLAEAFLKKLQDEKSLH